MEQVKDLRAITKSLIEAQIAAAKDSNHPINLRMKESLQKELQELEKLRAKLIK